MAAGRRAKPKVIGPCLWNYWGTSPMENHSCRAALVPALLLSHVTQPFPSGR